MSIKILKLFKISLVLALIISCSAGDQFGEIRGFMIEVKNKPRGSIVPLPEFEAYQPFTYGASNQRSPFEPPAVLSPMNAQKKSNIIIRPPRNHIKEYLEGFSLSALAMVGSIQKGKSIYALIADSEGGVHRVQKGDYIGDQWGHIESIEETRIDIMEIVEDGAGGWLRRPRTIELRKLQ